MDSRVDTAVPRYIQIERHLRAQIADGTAPPGTRIPSETVLARDHAVSRETVRKALDLLVEAGLLFRRPGKGTFVATRRIAHPSSTQTSLSATLDGLGLAHTTRVLLAAVVPADPHVARALSMPTDTPVACIRRMRLIDDDPIAIHTTCLLERYRAILDRDLHGSLQALLLAMRVPIVSSNDSLQAVQAADEEARLLRMPLGAPLMRIEGVGMDASGSHIRHTDSLYRGDRFRFTHDTERAVRVRLEIRQDERSNDDGDTKALGSQPI